MNQQLEMWGKGVGKSKEKLKCRLSDRIGGIKFRVVVGIKPLRGFFPSSAGHHRKEANRHYAGAYAVFFAPHHPAWKRAFVGLVRHKKIAQPKVARFALFRDSVGIDESKNDEMFIKQIDWNNWISIACEMYFLCLMTSVFNQFYLKWEKMW